MQVRGASSLLAFLFVVAACGSAREVGFDKNETKPPPESTNNPPVLGDGKSRPTVSVTLSGTVHAPNGKLAMANTLVYVTPEEPKPIPEGAYCDECVTLPPGSFAMSASDGTFEIATEVPVGDVWVVVQKGQFRRVRKVEVEEAGGELELDDDDALTLPGRSAPSKGDDVPKMVVLKDSMDFDKIDSSLKKLGITEFDMRNDRSLLEDFDELMKYHVVFIPCGSDNDSHVTSESAKTNLQNFVAAGGKLYVTDWSYEFVRQPFPGYVSWEGETSEIGSGTGSEWDAPASANDQGLGDWLAATGDSSFTVKGNWTTIASVNTMPGTDPKGNPVDIEPKVWVVGDKQGVSHPTTISFENQCGRVLFSTYHTEAEFGGSSNLAAQEKALLYVLLEVGVCIGDVGGVQ
jgi:hypothetical protein